MIFVNKKSYNEQIVGLIMSDNGIEYINSYKLANYKANKFFNK